MSNDSRRPTRARPAYLLRGFALLCALVVCAAFGATRTAADSVVDESRAARVKAAYLRYIAEFTTWPSAALGPEGDPIVVGVLGADPHGLTGLLERAIDRKGLQAQNRPLVLLRLPDPETEDFNTTLDDCHLIFLSEGVGAADLWGRLRELLSNRPIMTVGEIPGFSAAAGMIEFVIDPSDDRVTMHIDLEAVQRAGLRLSSRLLGLKQGVKIVRTPLAQDACVSTRCAIETVPAEILRSRRRREIVSTARAGGRGRVP